MITFRSHSLVRTGTRAHVRPVLVDIVALLDRTAVCAELRLQEKGGARQELRRGASVVSWARVGGGSVLQARCGA